MNITSMSPTNVLTYTNYVNYTQQGVGLKYNTFRDPLNNTKILLFMTSLFIFGQLENGNPPFYPIDLRVSGEPISNDEYYMRAELSLNVRI